LIELHSTPRQPGRIVGYRTGEDQSAGIGGSSLSASRSRRRVASTDVNSQVQGYGPTRSIPRACA
jgi:hypothetical protein